MTGTDGLRPDILVIGKSIGGGIPCGAYGIAAEIAEQVATKVSTGDADIDDVGGVGGTLAGMALSTAAMRATLSDVLTDDAFVSRIELSSRYTAAVQTTIDKHGLPWSIAQLGARAEYRFTAPAPRTGNEAAAASDPLLDEYFHLYLCNRGVLLNPFHNIALMCPATTDDHVDMHPELFSSAVENLLGGLTSGS